jgi:transcriptional regulator with XRE-family HTH domain
MARNGDERKRTTATIADLIHSYLTRTGLTDGEFGDLVGVHQTQISRWKRGTGVPRVSYVEELAEVLDVDVVVVEAARVNGEAIRVDLAKKGQTDPATELARVKKELKKAIARVARLERDLKSRG